MKQRINSSSSLLNKDGTPSSPVPPSTSSTSSSSGSSDENNSRTYQNRVFPVLLMILITAYFATIRSVSLPTTTYHSLRTSTSSSTTASNSEDGEFQVNHAMQYLHKLTSFGDRVTGSYNNEVVTVNWLKEELQKIQKEASQDQTSSLHMEIDIHYPSSSFYLDFLGGITNVSLVYSSFIAL